MMQRYKDFSFVVPEKPCYCIIHCANVCTFLAIQIADGHVCNLAFGLNRSGIIDDERVKKYK